MPRRLDGGGIVGHRRLWVEEPPHRGVRSLTATESHGACLTYRSGADVGRLHGTVPVLCLRYRAGCKERISIVKMVDDFKAFFLRGNVVDLAVAIVIGAIGGKPNFSALHLRSTAAYSAMARF